MSKHSKRETHSRISPRTLCMMALATLAVLGLVIAGVVSYEESVSADEGEFGQDGFVFKVASENDRTAILLRCNAEVTEANVPGTVVHNGVTYKVVSIDAHAFHGNYNLVKVTLPDTVKEIGERAFLSCSNLTTVNIPSSVTKIGYSAFRDCINLTNIDVSEDNEVYSSVDGILFSKDKKTLWQFPGGKGGEYTTPDFVETIEWYAFSENDRLTSITITSNVKQIEDHAFFKCPSLTSVIFSEEGVSSILWSTFEDCSKLKTLKLPDNITFIDRYSFKGCGELVSVNIPASVDAIGDSAFGGCYKLEKIVVDPDNDMYTSIEGVLFDKDVTKLLQFPSGKSGDYEVPSTVTMISKNSFAESQLLRSVSIGNTLESIGEFAFYMCSQLTSVNIPQGITSINASTFEGCVNLASITLHDGLRFIEKYAFMGCVSLTELTLPDSVQTIGMCAFKECTGLRTASMSDNVLMLGYQAFYGCSSLTSLKLSNGIPHIEDEAFFECVKLESLSLPSGLETMGDAVFYGCVSITSLTIPSNLKGIGSYTFFGCEGLESLIISEGMDTIGVYSFSKCTKLSSVIIPSSIETLGHCVFKECTSLTELIVDDYNPMYSSKDGVMFSKDGTVLEIYPCGKRGAYTIPADVVSINRFAFDGSVGLTSITIHDSEMITEAVFNQCPNLKEINIDESDKNMTSVDGVLYSKDRSSVVKCPEGRTGTLVLQSNTDNFGNDAFYRTLLDTIVVTGGDVISIGSLTFSECNPDLKFDSGREGFELEVFSNEEMTERIDNALLSRGFYDKLYLKWTEIPSPPEPASDDPANDNDGLITIGLICAIFIVEVALFIVVRRKG